MTCISISRDSRYMLINMAENEVQLIDIETADLVRRFLGQRQSEFIIRSAFGGADENLIISGSEGECRRRRAGSFYVLNRSAQIPKSTSGTRRTEP